MPVAALPPSWPGVFISALVRTGNVRVASAEAGVDYSTAYHRRQRDAEFRAAWADAVREGEFRGSLPAGTITSSEERAGENLVVRLSATGAPAKLVRVGPGRWSMAREERFLEAMAECPNVRRAAGMAGISTQAIYRRRLRNPKFAASWDAAIDIGKARIETYLIEAADRTFDPELALGAEDVPKVSVGEAIAILRLKRAPAPAPVQAEDDDPHGDAYAEEVAAARERILSRFQRMGDIDRERKLAEGWTEYEDELIPPEFARLEESVDRR